MILIVPLWYCRWMMLRMSWSYAILAMLCLLEWMRSPLILSAVSIGHLRSVSSFFLYLILLFYFIMFLLAGCLHTHTSIQNVFTSNELFLLQFLGCPMITHWTSGQSAAAYMNFLLVGSCFQVQLIMICFVFIWNWRAPSLRRCSERLENHHELYILARFHAWFLY